MYTVSFMLGDNLEDVGKLMLDDDITDLVNNYNSSIFDEEQNVNKIDYIEKAIKETADLNIKAKYKLLLDKAIAAEEVRILGKILKINQGLPTNTSDAYSYIKSIEKYIENKYNVVNITAVKEALNALLEAHANGARFGVTQVLKLEYYKLKAKMTKEWIKFDLVRFINDPEYKKAQIEKYEEYKTNFNILEVIAEVPHFKEMFNVLALNKQILNSLSTRNELEDVILNKIVHISSSGKPDISRVLNKEEIRNLKDRIDLHLINSWIISKQITINIPAGANNNPAPEVLRLDSPESIIEFRKWVENYAIPLLKQKLPDNRFISLLTFGLKKVNDKDIPFYKLPFNMVQVDNTQKTRSLYEEALYAFNNLKTIKIEGIDMNLVDMFYLYNLLVNQDRFGPNSITRIFEDLISSADSDKLLVYDFNSWIDKQDAELLAQSFPISSEELGVIQIDENNDPNDEDVKIVSEGKTPQEIINDIGQGEVNKTLKTVQSDSDQFTQEERKSIKSILGNTKLKVVVASEHTDPMFHVKKVKELVETELAKPVKDREFHMMYIITKHDGLPLKELVDLKIPKFYHFSITTLGGTKYEPGVMKMDDLLDRIAIFIKDGLINPNMVTIRIDPIIPGVTNKNDVEHVIIRAKELGIRQFKFSIMDSYGYTDGDPKRDRFIVSKMKSLGYEWEKYYDFKNGKYSYNAKPEIISEWYHIMDDLAQKYDIRFNTCGEQPKYIKGLKRIRTDVGCVNVDTINAAMGTNDVADVPGTQRKECSCYGLKTDALCYDDTCASSCAFCYARHNSDVAMKYYDENGNLLHNAFTDPYYQPKYTVTYTPKGKKEQTYTVIGDHIYNKKGVEVFKTKSVDRTIILTNLAIKLAAKTNTTQSNPESFAEEWSKKEGWSVDYFNKKVRPKIEKGEAWQIEYKVSDDQESPAKEANMVFSYNGAQRSDVKAKTTLEAIKLGERTATTRYESDGHIDTFWKQFKVGDRIKFYGHRYKWARTSNNAYEVSSRGDQRFSALYATFKPGTIIDGVDVGGRTIEDVYQFVIKKSGKGKAPAKDSKLYNESLKTKEEQEDFSYVEGYLPLWQEWARQNPELIEELRRKVYDKTLTDQFANTKVSQARALSDILNNMPDNFVIVEVTKPLTKLVLPKTTTSNSSSGTQLSLDFAADPDTDTSDFGFKKPIADADVEEARLEQQADSQDEKPSDSSTSSGSPTSYYDTNSSVQADLISLVKSANIKGLHLTSDAELVNEDSTIRNAKGFIRDGEIYINTDRATDDTVIHEFGHLYLADAKKEHSSVYYGLLSQVRQTKTWKTLRALPEYANKRGSDFDEEVLATIISNYYKNNDNQDPEYPFFDGDPHEDRIVLKAIDLVSPEFKELLVNAKLPKFNDAFISYYKESQRLATVKDELIKDKVIEENCK